MKKKIMLLLMAFILLPAILFTSGCVATGKSAYDIAVEQGYTGTVNEWLNSLKGQDGTDGKDGSTFDIEYLYESALDNGFTGTYLEFLKEFLNVSQESTQDISQSINMAMLSSVSVFAEFDVLGGETRTSAGSGVIYTLDKINGNAYIITNYHVVYNTESSSTNKISTNISIYLYGAQTSNYAIPATYIGGTMTYDIAVLKITNSNLLKSSHATAVQIANSDSLTVGEQAVAIGNPNGNGIAATLGIVSVDSEYITMKAADDVTSVTYRVIRVDTAINGGNSGGGLFNASGKLIGIVNAKTVDLEIENIGYAIPSNIAVWTAQNLIDNYETNFIPAYNQTLSLYKPLIGVTVMANTSKAVYNSNDKTTEIIETIQITEMTPNSIAQTLGLQANDIITQIKLHDTTIDINRMFTLIDSFLNIRPNDTVEFKILRNNISATFTHTFIQSDFVLID